MVHEVEAALHPATACVAAAATVAHSSMPALSPVAEVSETPTAAAAAMQRRHTSARQAARGALSRHACWHPCWRRCRCRSWCCIAAAAAFLAPPLPRPPPPQQLLLLLLLLLLPDTRAGITTVMAPCEATGSAHAPREQRGAAAATELGRGRAVGGGGGATGLLALAPPPPPSRAAAPVHSCAERPASSARPSSPDECALS